MKVLIIEDNVKLSKNIAEYLKIKWIKTDTDFDWNRWFQKALGNHYDVIILDINLPWKDWLEICKDLRNKGKFTPILMLTSRTDTDDIIKWLDIWADDYLGKPFDYGELMARIDALNRRNAISKTTLVEIWDIEVDIIKRVVKKNWDIVEMSTLEFDLLKFFLQNRWVPIDRKEILEKVWWEFDAYMFSRNVDVYVGYLRKKLWNDLIQTKKWFWYVIE